LPKAQRAVGCASGHAHPKRSKFKNIRTTIGGITFASKKEAARWLFLKELEAAGVIDRLERQIRYPLHVNEIRIGTYIPDFRYWVNGEMRVEDVKGKLTALYRRSAKHLAAQYGINVIEVYRPDEPV